MIRSKASLLPVASLLWLACFHGFAHAASPADTDTPATLTTNQSADIAGSLPRADSLPALASYQQVIADLETRPRTVEVDAQLGEAYYGLGSSLQTAERHEEAVEAFGNALQLLREHKGLYGLEQLPVLQAQLDSSQARASWQEVDAGRHLSHLITLKNPAAGTERRYQTLRELGLWKLRVAEDELLPNALDGAGVAAALYRHELEQPGVRASYQGRNLSLANLYLDLAALEFMQARKKFALPISAYIETGQRSVTQMQCQTIQTPDGRGRQLCRSVQVPNLDFYLAPSNRKYRETRDHLDAMKDAVLEAYTVLLGEIAAPDRDDAVVLLSEVHRLTGVYNNFVAVNSRTTGSRIAPPTGSRIRP